MCAIQVLEGACSMAVTHRGFVLAGLALVGLVLAGFAAIALQLVLVVAVDGDAVTAPGSKQRLACALPTLYLLGDICRC